MNADLAFQGKLLKIKMVKEEWFDVVAKSMSSRVQLLPGV